MSSHNFINVVSITYLQKEAGLDCIPHIFSTVNSSCNCTCLPTSIVITAGTSAISVFNNIFLACIVDLCILEDNCVCERPSGSIVDSGELGNQSVYQLTFVKVIQSHSLSQPCFMLCSFSFFCCVYSLWGLNANTASVGAGWGYVIKYEKAFTQCLCLSL